MIAKQPDQGKNGEDMASNFDFLMARKDYKAIAKTAMEAERRFGTSYPECAILAERAVKLAVRWMFTHDAGLALPYREAIARLIHEPTLKKLRPAGMNSLVHYILHLGNVVAYRGMNVSREEALLALRGLHAALSWLAACYEEGFSPTPFNESFLPTGGKEHNANPLKLLELYKEPFEGGALLPRRKKNREASEKFAALREKNRNGSVVEVPADLLAETRGRYILVDSAQAGWTLGEDFFMNAQIEGAGKRRRLSTSSLPMPRRNRWLSWRSRQRSIPQKTASLRQRNGYRSWNRGTASGLIFFFCAREDTAIWMRRAAHCVRFMDAFRVPVWSGACASAVFTIRTDIPTLPETL